MKLASKPERLCGESDRRQADLPVDDMVVIQGQPAALACLGREPRHEASWGRFRLNAQ